MVVNLVMAMTVEEFRKLKEQGTWTKKGRLSIPAGLENSSSGGDKQPKYRNVKTPDPEGGRDYDSKLEARHGRELALLRKAGEIASFTRQPRFYLEGGVEYVADFLVLHLDGTGEVIDSKGMETPEFRNKEKQFRARYPNIKLTVRYRDGKPAGKESKRASKE